jgi:pimeloyl-ACP methyl ester carboxylesterase
MEHVVQSAEAIVKVNDVELCYDTFGDASNPALVFIEGLGMPMIATPDINCRFVAASGYFVVRVDNRDTGKSTKFDAAGIPSVEELRVGAETGILLSAPYTLSDMANDVVGLLDALDIDRAHIVGEAMGGMIGQILCIQAPERVQTLTSIGSCPGWLNEWPLTGEALNILLEPIPMDRTAFCDHYMRISRLALGTNYPFNDELYRQFIGQLFDREYSTGGPKRQLAAIFSTGIWVGNLETVQTPTLVIHGDADVFIPVAGGKATAEALPNSKLIIIEGMGHTIPEAEGPRVFGAILEHTKSK